jgi:hypothetical protein
MGRPEPDADELWSYEPVHKLVWGPRDPGVPLRARNLISLLHGPLLRLALLTQSQEEPNGTAS